VAKFFLSIIMRRCPSVKNLLKFWDALSALAVPVLALSIRDWSVSPQNVDAGFAFYIAFSVIATLTLLQISGVSNAAWRFFSFPDAIDAFSSIGMGIIVAVAASFLHDRLESVPRSVPFIHMSLQVFAYVGARFILKRLANRLRPLRTRPNYVLLVGCNQTSYIYARAVESIGRNSIKIVGALTHDPTMVGHTMRGIPIVSTFDKIEEAIGRFKLRGVNVKKLILSANEAEIAPLSRARVQRAANRFNIPLIDIHTLFSEVAMVNDDEDELGVDAIELRGSYWLLKRGLDAVAAATLLIVLSPVMFIGAMIVAVDLGFPVVFWQERPGKHGKAIHVYKFRSMRDAIDPEGYPLSDEARTSRLGTFLRASRLDELPQLWNILKGDMSFIGPRPLLLVDQPEEVSQRLAIRPGVSGWAQVNGGRLISPSEKRALDLWYIAHASLWLDLLTLWKTIAVVMNGDQRNEAQIERALMWLDERENVLDFTVIVPEDGVPGVCPANEPTLFEERSTADEAISSEPQGTVML
jgi:lipopolysaccharide/colanic/teichoic acid biosynthesis glycosyltransferase